MEIDTFTGYRQFMAIKFHYGGKYDFHKYNGKTSIGWKQFEKFSGKRIIHNLLRKHKDRYVEFVATAFAYHPTISWVGDLNGSDVDRSWTIHCRNLQALTYTYKTELEELLELGTIKEVLTCDDDLPIVERRRNKGLTSMETCCILDDIFQYINKECTHPLWEKAKVVQRYTPFLGLNRSRFVDITKNYV